MAKSKQTFNKNEREKRKHRERKQKEEKREERKTNNQKGKSLEDMFAYVDEYGRLSSTPPNPSNKISIKAEDIAISISRKEESAESSVHKGSVTFFNESKGYGFIRDIETNESIFVHITSLTEEIKENDKVIFEVEKSVRGLAAVHVKLDA